MLYDITFARRFWRGKRMIVSEQTRLRAFVLAGFFTKVCLGQTVLRSACIKKVPMSQRAGPRFAQNSMLYGSSSQWSDGFNASRIFLLKTSECWHRYVCTRSKPTYTQHILAECLCIFWFRVRLLWVLESAMECSRHNRLNRPFSQTQLVEMVTWQVQYVKKQGLRFSLQFTQCKEEAANNLLALKA